MTVQLVTPERTVLTQEVASLACPTSEGQITILPGHTPIISTLVSGELTAKGGPEGEHNIHVAGGFLQVKSGAEKNSTEIIVLADAAEHFYEIDMARAEEAKAQAEATLKEQNLSDEEYAMAAIMLQRNLSRINIARKHAHRKSKITGQGVFHE